MQKNEKQISIVIVSSKIDYLEDCLKTTYTALKGIANEIIIIDNASPNKIGDKIKQMFPEVIIIRREVNGGFGENNNMGMKIAKGKYILLLNDDTKILDKDIFKEMITWMDIHPKVGLSSCALVNPDGKTYQGSGGYFPTLPRVIAWMTFIDDIPGLDNLIKPYHPMHGWSPIHTNENYYKKIHKQDWVTGAFFLMRKEAMDKAGIFDEDFFLYVEEVELAYRFVKSGWEVWYLPMWKTLHFGMTTTGSEKAMVMEMRNLKLFYSKHMSKWQIPILTLTLKFGALLRLVIYAILGRFNTAKIYAKAFTSI
ncbi:MAG: glycosyltransferase family 2 protein [Candidatus Woesebacteria bacterium]|nr:glycosyltransferase family 2 protein [Candidatus Woesebacteria bacterium]